MRQKFLAHFFPFYTCITLMAGSGALAPDITWGQVSSRNDLGSQERFKHDPDFPVLGTEGQRAEAKQEEGKEEALKSLQTSGELTVIPVPAVAFSRNEGAYYGLIVPILKPDTKGHLEDIFAPQYLHNKYIGESFTMNYYGYPSDTTQYNVILSYSTKVQREIDMSYKNVGAGGGRYILAGHASWFKNPFRRFFGVGSQSEESDETSYTSKEIRMELTAGINLAQNIALMWSERFHQVRIEEGIIKNLPQIREQFPTITGIDGADILGHKLTFRYDTRDRQLISTQGTYVNLSAEWNQNFAQDALVHWWRGTVDARHLIPHFHDRLVFVSHLYADVVKGGEAPFYERPTLGGENSLRGFGRSRFIDNTALVVNLEERVLIRQQTIFGYLLDFEIAPFIDIGRVGSHFGTNTILNPQVNPGLGFRFLARPHIVGRVDVAYGSDGVNVFAGLDYPF
ncbi:MAG: BamA/TamA family outer membrane protein [Nitrospirales bacterium]|nr:outer membrane protein assembly factor [Nitrospirales bacterium]